MGAVHRHRLAVQAGKEGIRGGTHRMDQVPVRVLMKDPHLLRQILHQSAAPENIDHLNAPAHPHNRLSCLGKRFQQSPLRPIPTVIRRLGAPVLLAVQLRVRVPAAAQQQTVARSVRGRAVTGKGNAARTADGVDVTVDLSGRPGQLDAGPHFLSSASILAWTMAAISSTAPSTPITEELMVRSYRRISPQVWPV